MRGLRRIILVPFNARGQSTRMQRSPPPISGTGMPASFLRRAWNLRSWVVRKGVCVLDRYTPRYFFQLEMIFVAPRALIPRTVLFSLCQRILFRDVAHATPRLKSLCHAHIIQIRPRTAFTLGRIMAVGGQLDKRDRSSHEFAGTCPL